MNRRFDIENFITPCVRAVAPSAEKLESKHHDEKGPEQDGDAAEVLNAAISILDLYHKLHPSQAPIIIQMKNVQPEHCHDLF